MKWSSCYVFIGLLIFSFYMHLFISIFVSFLNILYLLAVCQFKVPLLKLYKYKSFIFVNIFLYIFNSCWIRSNFLVIFMHFSFLFRRFDISKFDWNVRQVLSALISTNASLLYHPSFSEKLKRQMLSVFLSKVVVLVCGTLYPAYRSYKAVRNKVHLFFTF